MKLSEIIKANSNLLTTLHNESEYKILILSNVTVNQISDILEYSLRKNGIKAVVYHGEYDNIIQGVMTYKEFDCVLIFWEISNVIDGFYYKIDLMPEKEIEEIKLKVKHDIEVICDNVADYPLVLINSFLPICNHNTFIGNNRIDDFTKDVNNYLISQSVSKNIFIIEIHKILLKNSLLKCYNERFFYSSRAPYTIDFFKSYSDYCVPIFTSIKGKAKKALILDCDNTLWKGVLGEDGEDGIEMSSSSIDGMIFHEIQCIVKTMSQKGIIIGLCSKNNEEDIENIIKNHKDMFLSDNEIAITKVNWQDKVENLKEIATELNIGLDSIVYVDDSDFEINNVQSRLPEIHTIKVPQKLYLYPMILRDNLKLFYNHNISDIDKNRVKMYQEENIRKKTMCEFKDVRDYLRSLNLQIKIFKNNKDQLTRIAQLTQKTNQFNLTTIRYTENEIKQFIENKDYIVYSFEALDKFGSYGLTGVAIVRLDRGIQHAEFDTFLISCRVIGREIEFAFVKYILQELSKKGIVFFHSTYRKTFKNQLTENFWDRCGFFKKNIENDLTKYEMSIKQNIAVVNNENNLVKVLIS